MTERLRGIEEEVRRRLGGRMRSAHAVPSLVGGMSRVCAGGECLYLSEVAGVAPFSCPCARLPPILPMRE